MGLAAGGLAAGLEGLKLECRTKMDWLAGWPAEWEIEGSLRVEGSGWSGG